MPEPPADRPTPADHDAVGCRVWVRCYAELSDLLSTSRRHVTFPVDLDGAPSVKDLIEGVGVPHTEVDLVRARRPRDQRGAGAAR